MSSHDHAPSGNDGTQPDRSDDSAVQSRLLRQHAEQLGTTAEELAAALDQLALQAEVVLHRLRGAPTH